MPSPAGHNSKRKWLVTKPSQLHPWFLSVFGFPLLGMGLFAAYSFLNAANQPLPGLRLNTPAQINGASSDTSKWKLYRNETYGFQVKYPDNWTVISSRGTPPEII